jgi:hypothetical protein
MIELKAEDFFNWVREQPDDKEIVMGQSFKSEVYTVGCILMQYAEFLKIDAHLAGWQTLFGENKASIAKIVGKHPTGQDMCDNFIISCNRGKCLTYKDAKNILAENKMIYGVV